MALRTTKQPSAAAIRLSKAIRGYFRLAIPPKVPYEDDPVVMLTEDVFSPLIDAAEDSLRDAESGEKDRLPLIATQLRAALEKVRGTP